MQGKIVAVLALAALAALAGCGPQLKTKLTCVSGTAKPLSFSMFDATHGGKHVSLDLNAGDAAGVCDAMASAARQMGFQVERTEPTELIVTGTDHIIVVYVGTDRSLTVGSPVNPRFPR